LTKKGQQPFFVELKRRQTPGQLAAITDTPKSVNDLLKLEGLFIEVDRIFGFYFIDFIAYLRLFL
jgi:hypothetical protein